MARTKLAVKDIRVPTKLSRALAIKAKFDDLDDLLDAVKTNVYSTATAISPTDGVVFLESATAALAMTLANGTVTGETMSLLFRKKTGTGTVVVTPAALTGGTTITFTAQGDRITLVWTGAAWTKRPGNTAVVA